MFKPHKSLEIGKPQDLTHKSMLDYSLQTGLQFSPFGALLGISQGFWYAQSANKAYRNIGMKTGLFAVSGFLYGGGSVFMAGLREENDPFNQAFGGALAGLVAGASNGNVRHGAMFSFVGAVGAYFVTGSLQTNY